jgi:predicted transcriptional regulator
MKLREVVDLLSAEIAFGRDDLLDVEITTAAASDLMSDILARVGVPDVLLTRLTNSQVIRTSSVFGIKAVVIVRGRPIDEKVIELAKEEEIVLLLTQSGVFDSCGRMFAQGVRGTATGSNTQQQAQ